METLQNAPARHGQAATKHPLVSVVMPAYNAEKYIGEAIRSVQSQTYAVCFSVSALLPVDLLQ